LKDFGGDAPGGDEGGSWGADAGCGGAVRDNGGYGPIEDSLLDEFFEGGYVGDIVDALLLFDLTRWRGCII
jgi:hypothetical protein